MAQRPDRLPAPLPRNSTHASESSSSDDEAKPTTPNTPLIEAKPPQKSVKIMKKAVSTDSDIPERPAKSASTKGLTGIIRNFSMKQAVKRHEQLPLLPKEPEEEEECLVSGGEIWDQFESIPDDEGDERTCERFFEIMTKVLRLFLYVVFFVIILGGILLVKACVLILTHQYGKALNLRSENKELSDTKSSMWLYLCLFAASTPYFITFLRTFLQITFGSHKWPSPWTILWTILMESIHTFGLCLLIIRVLPRLDLIHSLLIMCGVAIVPSLLNLILGMRPKSNTGKKVVFIILDILAVVFQLSVLVLVLILDFNNQNSASGLKFHFDYTNWETAVSVVCIGFSWRENFYNGDLKCGSLNLSASTLKSTLYAAQAKLYFIISIVKCGLLFGLAFALKPDLQPFAVAFGITTKNGTITITSLVNTVEYSNSSTCPDFHPLHALSTVSQYVPFILLIFIPLVVFYISIQAAQLKMQQASFALATALATPVAISIAVALEMLHTEKNEFLCFFNRTGGTNFKDSKFIVHMVVGLALWWVSQMWLARHIWVPKNYRLERVQRLFVQPLYDTFLLEQSLIYNRRKDEDVLREQIQIFKTEDDNDEFDAEKVIKESITPMVYICATMWHENVNEMLQILKSIFRLDEDQAARRNVADLLQVTRGTKIQDPDYYEFEAHILFDDAFQFNDMDDTTVNSFVVQLVETMNSAASSIYNQNVELNKPVKIPTPYGGRLEWTMPGDNKIIAHLKDKNKIRHRKRWSQIMYMYYLLGYKLLGTQNLSATIKSKKSNGKSDTIDSKDLKKTEQATHFMKAKVFDDLPQNIILKAENTFCMALDGDVDFKPYAVQLLIDRLRRNKKVGVVCGRIHPIGSGPMVWYQKFEYAISHWLQKAAEHVLGCVLCAPGAFSLFRGSALMDDNVMNTYSKLATEASHFLQYDQGEDRWLCTLLLQQGYRIEYVAAADALTYAPEGIHEFFNQRRRWGPSTMANILDLLFSWKRTIRVNDNISWLYMVYQALIFGSSILGPATIVLMLVGAFNSVLGVKSLEWSFALAIVPPALYLLACFFVKPDTQIYIASIATAFYAVLMSAVLIGTLIEIFNNGILSPSGIFLVLVAGIMIIAGILHPQELTDLFSGLLYFLTIPSGYLLLTIYMLTNMHNVSWGTREVAKPKPKTSGDQPAQSVIAKPKPKDNFLVGLIDRQLEEDSLCGKIGQFFRQCCGKSNNDQAIYDLVKKMSDKLEEMEKAATHEAYDNIYGEASAYAAPSEAGSRRTPVGQPSHSLYGSASGRYRIDEIPEDDENIDMYYQMVHRDDLINPVWLEEKCLNGFETKFLDEQEIVFWKKFIKKYLQPLDKDEQKEKKIALELKEMRNNSCLAFFLINALWIAIMYMISVKKDDLKKLMIEYDVSKVFGLKDSRLIQIEPLGLIFLSIFGITLILQFIGMLWHRWGTLRHIMASTIDFIPDKKTNMMNEARKTAKAIARLEPDYQPGDDDEQSKKDGDGSDESEPVEGFKRRATRISIRKRFERNLTRVMKDAKETAHHYDDNEEEPEELPPRPNRRATTRAHTVRLVKRLQSFKRNDELQITQADSRV